MEILFVGDVVGEPAAEWLADRLPGLRNTDHRVGTGVVTLGEGDRRLTVVNLLSPSAVSPAMRAPRPEPIWPAWRIADSGQLAGTVLVDLHGESAIDKAAFAVAVDGSVAAVLGTHTHDPTLRCHLLDGGTGYVAEVGMTGALGHVGLGFDGVQLAAALRGENLGAQPPHRLADGELSLGAVHLTTANGLATRLSRIS